MAQITKFMLSDEQITAILASDAECRHNICYSVGNGTKKSLDIVFKISNPSSEYWYETMDHNKCEYKGNRLDIAINVFNHIP